MAHKKQRRQTGNIYNRCTYIKPSPKNALKMHDKQLIRYNIVLSPIVKVSLLSIGLGTGVGYSPNKVQDSQKLENGGPGKWRTITNWIGLGRFVMTQTVRAKCSAQLGCTQCSPCLPFSQPHYLSHLWLEYTRSWASEIKFCVICSLFCLIRCWVESMGSCRQVQGGARARPWIPTLKNFCNVVLLQ